MLKKLILKMRYRNYKKIIKSLDEKENFLKITADYYQKYNSSEFNSGYVTGALECLSEIKRTLTIYSGGI